MATKDTVVQELVVNTLTQAQFDAAKEAGTLSPYELYGTPDTSVRLPVLTPMWFDHITNDVSWLRADTFSWQSGDVYVAAYEHLVDDRDNASSDRPTAWFLELDTVDAVDSSGNYIKVYAYAKKIAVGEKVFDRDVGVATITSLTWAEESVGAIESITLDIFNLSDGQAIEFYGVATQEELTEHFDEINNSFIFYTLAEDGHKICRPDQEAKITALYEATGVAWYYLLDTTNKQFKLPRSKHNKYADTVPVVGNGMNLGLTDGTTNIGFGFKTSDQSLKGRTDFYGEDVGTYGALGGVASAAASGYSFGVTTDPEKSGIVAQQAQDTDQYKYLYFYVGYFEQDAVEQTAGINAETFNAKADLNLMNTASNVDIVIESQLPTADNGYTWYRKYKSGWVEQGGYTKIVNIALPVEMLNSKEYTALVQYNPVDGDVSNGAITIENKTTTGFDVQRYSSGTDEFSWQVSGKSA